MEIGEFEIGGEENAQISLNGLLISNGWLRISGALKLLRLLHCTLVPGLSLSRKGTPEHRGEPSLIVQSKTKRVEIENSIVGSLRAYNGAEVHIRNSIIDATAEDRVAFAGLDGDSAGGLLHLENCTIIGKVHTRELQFASNTILLACLRESDTWIAPVISERLQAGCVRFSYLPSDSRVPRRFRCMPGDNGQANLVRPRFTSLRYGDPGYCQLSQNCPAEILQGAEDQAEIGAFHDLYQPQREANLRASLDEYLRFGMEAGIFYAT